MTSVKQLRARAQLCRDRARTARNPISRANFLAFAEEYERQAGRTVQRTRGTAEARGDYTSLPAGL